MESKCDIEYSEELEIFDMEYLNEEIIKKSKKSINHGQTFLRQAKYVMQAIKEKSGETKSWKGARNVNRSTRLL